MMNDFELEIDEKIIRLIFVYFLIQFRSIIQF